MKFTAREDFKHGTMQFENGNTYNSEKYGLSQNDVNVFYESGWVSVDGWEDIERNPKKAVLIPEKLTSKAEVQSG